MFMIGVEWGENAPCVRIVQVFFCEKTYVFRKVLVVG